MKSEFIRRTLGLLSVLSLVLIIIAWYENDFVNELQQENERLTEQTQAISRLKIRWSAQESQSDFAYLEKHPRLVKLERHGKNTYFEFDDLSSGEFNALTNKLLNSMLCIKKMTLKRNGASKGNVVVEIES